MERGAPIVVALALSMIPACGAAPSSSAPVAPSAESKPQSDLTPALAESEWAILDKRESRARTRELEMIVVEIKRLEPLLVSMSQESKDRPATLRLLAEDYVELAVAAQRDGQAATARGDQALASSRKVTTERSRRGAINYYSLLINQYGGTPPVYANLDEAEYGLAIEYYLSGDAPRTRKVLLDLVKQMPGSKYTGRAYVLFGELFASEVPGDKSRYRAANQAFSKAASASSEQDVAKLALTRLAAVALVAGDPTTANSARFQRDALP
jgi:TolA-binding protein